MERHQASLHLRDRSWSCAALERNHDAAFHQSPIIPPIIPGHTQPPLRPDVCGYCGQQFPNPPDYLARADHLSNVHKFADCNQSKKFWRADHFRQHLKHSHGGIPGKWTNMLEQACIKMEISPLPQHQHPHGGGGGGGGGDDGSHMAQQQAAHAAIVAQAAADQAQRAVQQQVQQAHQHQHQQQQQHHNHNHHPAPPPLSSYQATQLQNATASNTSSGLGDSRRGPYPSMQSANDFGPMISEGQTE